MKQFLYSSICYDPVTFQVNIFSLGLAIDNRKN